MTANNEAVKEVSALTLCTSFRELEFSETASHNPETLCSGPEPSGPTGRVGSLETMHVDTPLDKDAAP